MPRPRIDVYENDSVAAGGTTTTNWPVIPEGKEWIVRRFGCRFPKKGRLELQVRISMGPAVWRVLRVCDGDDTDPMVTIKGDGTIAKMRVQRFNEDTADAQIMPWWIEGPKR